MEREFSWVKINESLYIKLYYLYISVSLNIWWCRSWKHQRNYVGRDKFEFQNITFFVTCINKRCIDASTTLTNYCKQWHLYSKLIQFFTKTNKKNGFDSLCDKINDLPFRANWIWYCCPCADGFSCDIINRIFQISNTETIRWKLAYLPIDCKIYIFHKD